MRTHDRRSDGAHAYANSSVLGWRGRVTNGVDLRVGARTQKRIDDHLVVLIHGQSSFPCQRRSHKASRPDTQVAGELAPLVNDNALCAHGRHTALIDDL